METKRLFPYVTSIGCMYICYFFRFFGTFCIDSLISFFPKISKLLNLLEIDFSFLKCRFKALVPYVNVDSIICLQFGTSNASNLRGGKRRSQKFHPNFQNRLQCMTSKRALNRKFSQRRIKSIVSSLFERFYG